MSLGGGDLYQERLSRLESDKESLILQVPVTSSKDELQFLWKPLILRVWLDVGERADRPGRGSGREDSRPGLVFG